jgi:antagonist of KipI
MTLQVLDPGLFSLVVDQGRPRYRSLGVPRGGSADSFALAIGNALVGNPPEAAALEVTLAGPTLRAGCSLGCVLFGAPFDMESSRQRLTVGTTFTLEPGEELAIAGTQRGARAYLCVRGGLQEPVILHSRSALQPLTAGKELACFPSAIGGRLVRGPWVWNRDPLMLRVLDGPQASWFDVREFYGRPFRVSQESDRMGVRLLGKPITAPARELASEPVSPGTVQVTPDRRCIVLGVDGQTIGGYPKIAQVISADLDKIGQLRPGDAIHFVKVTLEEAQTVYHAKQEEIRRWLLRLRICLRENTKDQKSF